MLEAAGARRMITVTITDHRARVKFGGDNRYTSDKLAQIPVNLCGSEGMLHVYVVPGWTPLLISLPVMKKLRAVVDMDTDTLKTPGKEPVSLRRGPLGH